MTMRLLLAALAAAFLSLAWAEDYQCFDDAGCPARITEDGVLNEVTLRKGDMVSTDAGWSVSTDDGWVKVKTHGGRSGGARGTPKLGLTIGEVIQWTALPCEIPTGKYATRPPFVHGQFLRPSVYLMNEAPREICLIGLR